MSSQTSSEKMDANGKLDKEIEAVCLCLEETKTLTYRMLKNKWPHCSCKQSMKIQVDHVPTSARD
jgi:hypothetical protein